MIEKDIKECWKPACGFEGKYEVSDLGRVRSLNYQHTGKTKILSPGNNRGYLRVLLFKDGKGKNFSVHTLVFWTFNGPIPPGMTVDHVNGDKRDNRPENLQLLTREDNTRKSHKGKTPWNKGKKCKPHSEETKLRMRAAHKGKKRKPFTEEHKAKLRKAKLGKTHSEETKLRMRAAQKARWSGIKNH